MNSTMKKTFEAWGLRWSRTKERGATAIVIALSMVIIMGAAALSFDSANLALQRQSLRNLIDASAQAGASWLPGDPASAVTAAIDYAHRYDPSFTPTTSLWCVIGSTGATMQPAAGFIPATCNPGGSGTYTNGVNGVVCDTILCAIPCVLTGTNPRCNTMRVDGNKDVPYYFAPAIGIPSGNTGAVTSVSCKGSCGTLLPNAMDVAFIADRTNSLDATVFSQMKQGITDTLSTMTPEYQFVTIGTIHKSQKITGCDTNLATVNAPTGYNATYTDNAARTGDWMPADFSNNYLTGGLGSVARAVNTSSTLVKDITCMNQATQPWGTHLAAPLKSAARKLLGYDTSSLSTMSAARTPLLPPGTVVKKVIIMETDGVPEETIAYNQAPYKATLTSKGNVDIIADNTDPVSGNPNKNVGGDTGCANLKTVAAQAKLLGITIIMIGYGDANTARCNGSTSGSSSYVKDVLAAAASPVSPTVPSTAPAGNCSDPTVAAAENSDNDFYFCAATGAQLSGIFSTAMAQMTSTTKFVKMPGS